jgi:multicomponent Na+:H+ antiporter subunit B
VNESEIVAIFSRKLVPFVLLFGFYLISFGDLSPGGGFQGGAVLASAVILLTLSRGEEEATQIFKSTAVRIGQALLFLSVLAVGFAGVAVGQRFLGNFLSGSTFVFILDLIIGVKVGAGITLICFAMLGKA